MTYRVNAGPIPATHWTQDPTTGGGRIVGEVCHFIDLMQFLTGSAPIEVCAGAAGGVALPGDPDNVLIQIRFGDGSVRLHRLCLDRRRELRQGTGRGFRRRKRRRHRQLARARHSRERPQVRQAAPAVVGQGPRRGACGLRQVHPHRRASDRVRQPGRDHARHLCRPTGAPHRPTLRGWGRSRTGTGVNNARPDVSSADRRRQDRCASRSPTAESANALPAARACWNRARRRPIYFAARRRRLFQPSRISSRGGS